MRAQGEVWNHYGAAQLLCKRHELGTSCLCVQTGDERSV